MIADAIVTGFSKSPLLLRASLAPLRALRQEGRLRNIWCVTWDSSELDGYVAPLQDMPDVSLIRVPQPNVSGSSGEASVLYQSENLKAALALIREPDALVLKTRPDFVADVDFLRDKVSGFATDCEIKTDVPFGIAMPKPAFRSKIWIPWADSNQPFFYEDATFLGIKADLEKLVTPLMAEDRGTLADPECGHYCHIIRFAKPFLSAYPLFAGYLKNYRHITNDIKYRPTLLPHMLNDAYFWFLIVAHAWVLHTQFHVDCGEQGDLLFYAGNVNKGTNWGNPADWRVANPYDKIERWRNGTMSDSATQNLKRLYGRLMDNSWQAALFTSNLPDMPRATLARLLENIAGCRDGRLNQLENAFYRNVQDIRRAYIASRSQTGQLAAS